MMTANVDVKSCCLTYTSLPLIVKIQVNGTSVLVGCELWVVNIEVSVVSEYLKQVFVIFINLMYSKR